MKLVEFIEQNLGLKTKLEDHYGDWLGYEIEDFDLTKNIVTTKLTIRKEHLSPSGSVHGGVVSGFLDFSCGCAVFTTLNKGELCSTVDLGVKYFKPLKESDVVFAKARVVNRGKKLCSVVTDLFDSKDTEKQVALATATFNIYPIKF